MSIIMTTAPASIDFGAIVLLNFFVRP